MLDHGPCPDAETMLILRTPLICPSLRLVVELLDVVYQIRWLRTTLAVLPLAAIVDTPNLLVQPDRTTRGHAHVAAMLYAVPQKAHAVCACISTHAIIQRVEIEPMFQRAVLNERLIRYLLVIVDEAIREAEMEFWVGVFGCCTQHEDVSETLCLTVHALHAIVVGELANEAHLEVDFVGDVGHGGYDEFLEAIARIGAFGPENLH